MVPAAIAELIHNDQKIHIVDRRNNKIGSDGIIALDAGIRRGGLRELNFSSNDMCPIAVKAIAGLIGNNQHKGVKGIKGQVQVALKLLIQRSSCDRSFKPEAQLCWVQRVSLNFLLG